MTILKKISKLMNLADKLALMKSDQASVTDENLRMVEKHFDEIVKSELSQNGLSEHIHAHAANLSPLKSTINKNKEDVYFQFANRLNALHHEEIVLAQVVTSKGMVTPPQSPQKSAPPSPSKLKSPSKTPISPLPAESNIDFEKQLQQLEARFLAEARSPDYLDRIIKLDEKINKAIRDLQKRVEDNKTKMKTSFKVLMRQNGLPYNENHAEALLGELFDIVHRDEGTFEKLVKALSQGFADKSIDLNLDDPAYHAKVAKIILEVRNSVIKNKPNLFSALGNVSVSPGSYFDSNQLSKSLAHNFIQELYRSPERLGVMMDFQQQKERSIKLEIINSILSFSPQLYYQDLLYIINGVTGQRQYIQSFNEIKNINDIKLVPWGEISNLITLKLNRSKLWVLKPMLSAEKIALIIKTCKKSYDEAASQYSRIPSASEQNSCISFFPLKLDYVQGLVPEFICLVTTSGDVNKIKKENKEENTNALVAFQNMIKAFVEESKPQLIEGVSYRYMYHNQEQGTMDVLLQQINKGLSGKAQALSSYDSNTSEILNDPFRACAEKKFISCVRDWLNDSNNIKSLKILGAANLRMPIIPRADYISKFEGCIQELHEIIISSQNSAIAEFKKILNIKIKEQFDVLSSLSINLGKSYDIFLEKNKITTFLTRGKHAGDLKSIVIDSEYELNHTRAQKQEHVKILQQHELFMLGLYNRVVNFLNQTKIEGADPERKEWISYFTNDVDVIRSHLAPFPPKFDSHKSKFESNAKTLIHGLSNRDAPGGKPGLTTDALIVRYNKEMSLIVQSRAIVPEKFSIMANYSNKYSAVELDTNFMACCLACQANKLPVLTWLTDLQLALQAKQEVTVLPLLFSRSPERVSYSPTTLSPRVKSMRLEEKENRPPLQKVLSDLPSEPKANPKLRVAKQLFS